MQLALTKAEADFARDVRQFFEEDYPRDLRAKISAGMRLTREDHVRSQQALNAKGWLGMGWPAEHGGPGWTPTQRYLFEYELERAGALNIIPMAVIYIGPIICAFGTSEQQARWLPDILESRAFWAQGYSEPEAGSDLASLKLKAVRSGDFYVLNGTKVWTSAAHWADWIFCLCRTSREERKQQGISLICVPMDTPGITIEPIISIDGSHELNRVIFEDVHTPVDNRIGEEGKAWHYANVLLASERISYAHIGRKKSDLAAIRRKASQLPGSQAATLLEEPAFQERLADIEIDVAAIETSVLRVLTGDAAPAAVSALKIACTELTQVITELWLEMAGSFSSPMFDRAHPGWAACLPEIMQFGPARAGSYLFERAQTIYGGATEVQKNIIWRHLARGGAFLTGS